MMSKLPSYLLLFFIFITVQTVYGQLDTIAVQADTIVGQVDTIIDGKTFNYVSWYDNEQIHELGNYLTKGNKMIKQGYWIVYDEHATLIEKGSYKKNKKTGNWTERGSDNNCCWTGMYKNNKKEGEWFNGGNRIIIYKNNKKKSVQIIEYKH